MFGLSCPMHIAYRTLFCQLRNYIVYNFSQILLKPKFSRVQKIKTIGSTYMAATGLNQVSMRAGMHMHVFMCFFHIVLHYFVALLRPKAYSILD